MAKNNSLLPIIAIAFIIFLLTKYTALVIIIVVLILLFIVLRKNNKNYNTAKHTAKSQINHSSSKKYDFEISYKLRKTAKGDKYFDTLFKFYDAKSSNNFELAGDLAFKNINQVSGFVEEELFNNKIFRVTSIPSLEHGGTILALLNRKEDLLKAKEIVYSKNELKPWRTKIDEHIENCDLNIKILSVIKNNPGCLQIDMKKLIGLDDGRRIANLILWLEKAGKILRTKTNKTYSLNIPDGSSTEIVVKRRKIESHRSNNKSKQCREISFENIPYFSLPVAPSRWEIKNKDIESTEEWFEIKNNNKWVIDDIILIPKEERPDPAFRKVFPVNKRILYVDDLGNSEEFNDSPVAIKLVDQNGNEIVSKGLEFDIYKYGINPFGNGYAFISKDHVLHTYDLGFNNLFTTSIENFPEVISAKNKFEISENELRNFIRTVALSNDNTRYLFTIVDEAWCIDDEGNCLWGIRVPLKEGWEKIESSSKGYNTSKDVEEALKIFGLELPFENDDLKAKYKELAKKWHPDINPSNPEAEHMMKNVNNAAEILTGIDTKSLPSYMGTQYVDKESVHSLNMNGFNVSISVEFGSSARFASDWIYASSFSDEYYNCYIGGYSGKIIEINKDGDPSRIYDIGAVPKQIIKSGKLLYLLTDTRLYILEEDKLISIIDVYDEGSLVMAATGFGLLQGKKFQWYDRMGKHMGTILTKNPIRKVLYSNDMLIIETRQRRAIINNVDNWWEDYVWLLT
jgi:hypothetical protein